MDLKTYITQIRKTTLRKFAVESGINYQSLSGYARKIHKPSLERAKQIEQLTDGHVTLYEMLTGEYKSYEYHYKMKMLKKKDDENTIVVL